MPNEVSPRIKSARLDIYRFRLLCANGNIRFLIEGRVYTIFRSLVLVMLVVAERTYARSIGG